MNYKEKIKCLEANCGCVLLIPCNDTWSKCPNCGSANIERGGIGNSVSDEIQYLKSKIKDLEDFHSGIDNIIEEHKEAAPRDRTASITKKIRSIVNTYHDNAVRAIGLSKDFRDDLLTYLRALSMVIDMAANGGTHREKESRMRGASEILESAIGKLREYSFDFDYKWHGFRDDIFRSDYPTRHYVHEIHRLKEELSAIKGEPAPKPPVKVTDDPIPF